MQESNARTNGYSLPPDIVVQLVDAPPEPIVAASPDLKWILFLHRSSHPSIEVLAKPIAKLAGHRFDPSSRCSFQTEFWHAIDLRPLAGGTAIRIPLAADSLIGTVCWSPNSQAVALTLVFEDRQELWWFSIDEPTNPQRLCDHVVESLGGMEWCEEGKKLIVFTPAYPEEQRPIAKRVPVGPVIEESIGVESPSRTYQDLLGNEADAQLFEFLVTTQIVVIDPQTLEKVPLGPAGLYLSCDPSPDGNYLIVNELTRPFSYTLPYHFFPRRSSVWDISGQSVFPICELPLADRIPIEGVRTGPRHIGWLANEAASIVWVEALDGGDPRKEIDYRDKLMSIRAPFQSPPEELLRVEHRYTGRVALQQAGLMLISEYDRERRWTRTILHDFSDCSLRQRVLFDRNIHDHYNDPGSVSTRLNKNGTRTAQQFGESLFLAGHGATPEGALPFLDLWDLKSWSATRLWRCEAGCYESVAGIQIDQEAIHIVTRHESKTSPPNIYLRNLPVGESVAITEFRDPVPLLRQFPKRLVKYRRRDGLELSATLYLPLNYVPGEAVPLLVWAYPQEYSDGGTAGQITSSPDRFTRLTGCSHLSLLTQGFAILDNATMPVVGDPETMNDRFIEQIVDSAQAAVEFAVSEGIADRQRVAVGGHSYGAFMVANLLAHSNLFKAGIARSGAYNRSLTPFGFQSERRPLWQAKEIYQQLSPFLFADQIKQPLLLIHGEEDNNPGTLTLQSKRMYQAVKGNGGVCRLVLLPHESHGYRARQSVLHTQAEMISWLNRYVRDC